MGAVCLLFLCVPSHNVIFDIDGKRVGFAPSSCKYEDFAPRVTQAPSPAPTRASIFAPNRPDAAPSVPAACAVAGIMMPMDECTATCNVKNSTESYTAVGTQKWSDKCYPPTRVENRPCHVSCSSDHRLIAAPVSILCPENPWSECGKQCVQTKTVQTASQPGGPCKKETKQISRPCYASGCPINDGDYLVFVDMKVVLPISKWSYVISENFFDAVAYMFNVRNPASTILLCTSYTQSHPLTMLCCLAPLSRYPRGTSRYLRTQARNSLSSEPRCRCRSDCLPPRTPPRRTWPRPEKA